MLTLSLCFKSSLSKRSQSYRASALWKLDFFIVFTTAWHLSNIGSRLQLYDDRR